MFHIVLPKTKHVYNKDYSNNNADYASVYSEWDTSVWNMKAAVYRSHFCVTWSNKQRQKTDWRTKSKFKPSSTHLRFSWIWMLSTSDKNFSMRASSTSFATSFTQDGAELPLSIPKWPIRIPTVSTAAAHTTETTTFNIILLSVSLLTAPESAWQRAFSKGQECVSVASEARPKWSLQHRCSCRRPPIRKRHAHCKVYSLMFADGMDFIPLCVCVRSI